MFTVHLALYCGIFNQIGLYLVSIKRIIIYTVIIYFIFIEAIKFYDL